MFSDVLLYIYTNHSDFFTHQFDCIYIIFLIHSFFLHLSSKAEEVVQGLQKVGRLLRVDPVAGVGYVHELTVWKHFLDRWLVVRSETQCYTDV